MNKYKHSGVYSMESRRNIILSREFGKFSKQKKIDAKRVAAGNPPKYWDGIEIITVGDDLTRWYVRITGLAEPYEEGEYLVRIEANEAHPMKPPKYYFMTPNGLYQLGKNACISISTHHSEDYPAVLGMTGFILNVIGAMLQWETLGRGTSLIHSSAEKKMKLAAESREYNRMHNIDIISQFEI